MNPLPCMICGIANDSGPLRFLLKQVCGCQEPHAPKSIAERNSLQLLSRAAPSILLFCVTSFANRRFNGIGTSRNFDVVRLRARDGQHQGGGVSEIALETDGAGALRQLRIQGIQLEVDIAELPLGIGDALIQLNGDKRIAGKRYGLDAVVRICSRMDGLILGGNVLNFDG